MSSVSVVSVVSGLREARSTLRTAPSASEMPPPTRPTTKRMDEARDTGRGESVDASPPGTSIAGPRATRDQDAEIALRYEDAGDGPQAHPTGAPVGAAKAGTTPTTIGAPFVSSQVEQLIEDDMADTCAQFVLSFVGFRMRRCLQWFG